MHKSFRLLLSMLLICSGWELAAQSTKGFHYQAVARGNSGELFTNTPVNLRFQIKSGSASGPILYQEVHNLSTNAFGLLNTTIGQGTVETGIFADVPWGDNDFFLAVFLNGTLVETSRFEAVPYAKVATAMSLNHLQDVNAPMPITDQVLKWDGSTWVPGLATSFSAGTGISISGNTISNTAPDQVVSLSGSGASSVSGSYPNFTISSTDNVNDADADATNELQSLSISGSNLSISNGNSVTLPTGNTYTGGTGIDITGANVINNTAPDQTVSLTGSGATSITGSYPNFTISSTDNVNDADASTTNEIQALSLSGNTLSLSLGGGSVSLASFASPWSTAGSNLFFNTGNVGIGDNSPVASLTVGNGDKLQIHGSDGDIVFSDDEGSIRFANSNGTNAPMIQMFQSGTNNSTRMLLAHSPSFSTWGIQYNDTSDAFTWLGDNLPVFQIQLAGQQRIGVGTFSPTARLHVYANSSVGVPQLKLTETQFDFARLTYDNNIHNNFWDLAARTDTNLSNAQFNIYHSDVGDIFSVNARRRVGINDASPGWPLEVNGNGESRTVNVYNNLPTTTSATFNYGVIVNLSQTTHTGFPRLFNVYGFSTDADAYLSYGVYGFASNATNFNYGVYGVAATTGGYAGYFSGNTFCTNSYITSDARFKSEISPVENGLTTLMLLKPKKYVYNTRAYDYMNFNEGEQYGFLADEVETILPSLTKHSFQGFDEPTSDAPGDQGIEFKALNYIGIIPITVSAVQEQQAIIEQQAAKIQSLEDRLQTLEALVSTLKQD